MGSPEVDSLAKSMLTVLENGPVVLTKYVFIAEGIDGDGDRAMYTAASEGIACWEEMGMLEWGRLICEYKLKGENNG